jgi:hypothetical protein
VTKVILKPPVVIPVAKQENKPLESLIEIPVTAPSTLPPIPTHLSTVKSLTPTEVHQTTRSNIAARVVADQEDDSHSAISPFILLEGEIPLSLQESIEMAYDGVFSLSKYEMRY